MAEYIEREAALDCVKCDLGKKDYKISYQGAMVEIAFRIDAIPAADVAPVRHGRNESGAGFMCSVCLFRDFGVFRGYKPNFCPNCGAKMDGGEA